MGRQATGDVRQSLPTCDKRKSESRDVAAHVACRVSRVLPLVIGNIGHWQHSHIGNIPMSARRFPHRQRRPVRGAQWLRLSTPKNFFRVPLPRPDFLVLYAQHTRRTACPIRRGMSIKGAFLVCMAQIIVKHSYPKTWIDHDAQVERLVQRGLEVADKERAKRILAYANYYRFTGYSEI